MDNKRNKKWRRDKKFHVFKKRLLRLAAFSWMPLVNEDGSVIANPHWFELLKLKWVMVYKITGTPCSSWICRSARYNRRVIKKEVEGNLKDEL